MIKDIKSGMNHRRNCSVFKKNLGKTYITGLALFENETQARFFPAKHFQLCDTWPLGKDGMENGCR